MSIFPTPPPPYFSVSRTGGGGGVSVLEIVFVGQCEVFVCLDFVHFFPYVAELIGPRMGCQLFKKKSVDFSVACPL